MVVIYTSCTHIHYPAQFNSLLNTEPAPELFMPNSVDTPYSSINFSGLDILRFIHKLGQKKSAYTLKIFLEAFFGIILNFTSTKEFM